MASPTTYDSFSFSEKSTSCYGLAIMRENLA